MDQLVAQMNNAIALTKLFSVMYLYLCSKHNGLYLTFNQLSASEHCFVLISLTDWIYILLFILTELR